MQAIAQRVRPRASEGAGTGTMDTGGGCRRGGLLDWSQPEFEGIDDSLRATLCKHVEDRNELDDVLSETYLRAVRYQGRLRDPERLRGWLLRIARNVLADRRRIASRWMNCRFGEDSEQAGVVAEPVEEVGEESLPLEMGAYRVAEEDAVALLNQELAALPAPDRRLLDSFYGGSASCRETGEELGLPRHVVKVRLFRARRRLARLLRQRLALRNANPEGSGGVERVRRGGGAS